MSKRTTLTLTDQDEETVRRFGDPDLPEGAVLIEAAGALGIAIGPGASEATVIRALMAAGAAAVREQALERGYQQVAAMHAEVHDVEEKAARRRRYAERVDRLMPE
jgi:hypothetical protein